MADGSNIQERMNAENTALETREATASELIQIYGEDVVASMKAAGQLTPAQAKDADLVLPPLNPVEL